MFDAFMGAFDWKQRYVKLYGKSVALPRLTAWAGAYAYTYSGIENLPLAWGAALDSLHDEYGFSGVLANLYRGGKDHVGWHSDDEMEDDAIISLSAGATRKFSIRNKLTKETRDFMLGDGDLFIMSRGMQADWEHYVRKTSKDVGPRINLTFRGIKNV